MAVDATKALAAPERILTAWAYFFSTVTNNIGAAIPLGIFMGFIILTIDKKPINSLDELTSILENKKGGVLIEGVYPNGMRAYYGFGL